MNRITTACCLALAFAAGCAKADKAPADPGSGPAAETADAPTEAAATQNIVEIAASDENFSTLVTAIETAGLADALQGDGPFTVFAPTNEAFAKLPEGTLDALLQDKDKLAAVLEHHVVEGKVASTEVVSMSQASTIGGTTLAIDASDGVKVGGATVVKADIMATNGVIHVIDTVIVP